MATDVLMPVITASGEEAVVTAWFVDEGDACTPGQLLAEVQAEKLSAEVESTEAGYVVDRVAVNEPLPQGSPICRIVDSVEESEASPTPTREREGGAARVVASPAAKRVAKEAGIDLAAVSGTGPGGRITEADVRAAMGKGPVAATGLRAVIARNMLRSHAETAPVTLHSNVALGNEPPSHLTARVVKAVAEALADHPHLNGYRDEQGVFVPATTAQVAVAIQTEDGLVAPVVREAASRTVEELAEAIRALADRANSKKLEVEDFSGGTFTVTNLGPYGIDGFTPIINLPQMAILGVGTARRVPMIDADAAVTTGYRMVLSLTFDHAFVDGAPAAVFLQQVGESLAG